MSLVLAGAAALSCLVALHAVRAQRALAAELCAVRSQLRDLAARLADAEKRAEEATARAQAAGKVLLQKGLANEADLEAARGGLELVDDRQPARGTRTLH